MLTPEVRYAVEDLIYAYVHCIDEDKLEEWPSFFATECRYTIMPREKPGPRLADSAHVV